MDSGLWWLLLGLVVVLVLTLVAVGAFTFGTNRARHRLEDALAASRDDLAAVQRRLDGLERVSTGSSDEPEFVITTAGLPAVPAPLPAEGPTEQLTARRFASVALGESLVTVVSFAYGVRRALSAENRNRIGFEMRREVRRARKQRRRDLKEAKRYLRDTQRHQDAA